jgi:hypothetical protein
MHFNTFTETHPGHLQEKKYQPRITTLSNEDKVKENVEGDTKPAAAYPNYETTF